MVAGTVISIPQRCCRFKALCKKLSSEALTLAATYDILIVIQLVRHEVNQTDQFLLKHAGGGRYVEMRSCDTGF